jgi:hypothetical protein
VALAADDGEMRVLGYIVAAWFLISILGSMAMEAGAAGGLFPLVAIVVIVWMVRSYRREPGAAAGYASASVGPLDHSVEQRLARLADELPPDPLDSDEVVNAWALHARDEAALERLRLTYSEIRQRYVCALQELAALRGRTETEDVVLLAAYQRLDAEVEQIRDYVGAVRVLADEGPELVERAIKEHADAERALEEARHSVAVNARTNEALVLADEKLQGARDALAKGDERPLDALRLAGEARRLAENL